MIVLGYKAVSVYSVLSTGIGIFRVQFIFLFVFENSLRSVFYYEGGNFFLFNQEKKVIEV